MRIYVANCFPPPKKDLDVDCVASANLRVSNAKCGCSEFICLMNYKFNRLRWATTAGSSGPKPFTLMFWCRPLVPVQVHSELPRDLLQQTEVHQVSGSGQVGGLSEIVRKLLNKLQFRKPLKLKIMFCLAAINLIGPPVTRGQCWGLRSVGVWRKFPHLLINSHVPTRVDLA